MTGVLFPFHIKEIIKNFKTSFWPVLYPSLLSVTNVNSALRP